MLRMARKQHPLLVSLFFVVTLSPIILTIYSSTSRVSYRYHANYHDKSDREDPSQLYGDHPCQATKDVEILRQSHNFTYVDPAHQVVEELLEIVASPPANFCMKSEEDSHFVVVLVNTARSHFMERDLIRNSWGSILTYRRWRVQVVFLMGQSDQCLSPSVFKNETAQNEWMREELHLREELEKHGDLVLGTFADTYRNLTYKHLMGYKFVLDNCPEADLIIKTDDDMFVDIPKIIDMREEELSQKEAHQVSDLYCHLYHDAPTRCRDCPNGKWFSTREEWPEDTYPLYCLGNDYVISRDWLTRIYSLRGEAGFFWVDDVFLMGKLRELAEARYGQSAKMRDIRPNVTDRRSSGSYVMDNCDGEEENLLGMFVFLKRSHSLRAEVECLWRRVLGRNRILTLA